MKKFFAFFGAIVLLAFLGLFSWQYLVRGITSDETSETNEVAEVLQDRQESRQEIQQIENEVVNPFDTNSQVKILLIGLDKRVGQVVGHCDVIQFISIDQKKQELTITAVPRGTYSPLPRGKTATSSEYYIANACGYGGLSYGIEQIEKILGQKADYVVVVGFSETLGIFRNLKLPTVETLQWLRRRKDYAVGEPQRARNHSTFLKQLMIQYIPMEKSIFDTEFRRIIYKRVQTDLSFEKANALIDALAEMDFEHHEDRIHLAMKPAYMVQDIPYNPEHLDVQATETIEDIQKKLVTVIDQKKENKEFVTWAFENDIWLQIEDPETRESIHYDFLKRILKNISENQKQEELVSDYILEMEYMGQTQWAQKGRELLFEQKVIRNTGYLK